MNRGVKTPPRSQECTSTVISVLLKVETRTAHKGRVSHHSVPEETSISVGPVVYRLYPGRFLSFLSAVKWKRFLRDRAMTFFLFHPESFLQPVTVTHHSSSSFAFLALDKRSPDMAAPLCPSAFSPFCLATSLLSTHPVHHKHVLQPRVRCLLLNALPSSTGSPGCEEHILLSVRIYSDRLHSIENS